MNPKVANYLTTGEVCAELRISPKTLQRMRKSRSIDHVRMRGKFLFPRTAIDQILNRLLIRAGSEPRLQSTPQRIRAARGRFAKPGVAA